jgi:hypothetical protein
VLNPRPPVGTSVERAPPGPATINVRWPQVLGMSWLGIALLLIVLGLIFGVGLFVEAGKVILIVILVLVLLGILGGMFVGGRRRAA